jgi:hypothetical protein
MAKVSADELDSNCVIDKTTLSGVIKGKFKAEGLDIFPIWPVKDIKEDFDVCINGEVVGKVTKVEVKDDGEIIFTFEVDGKTFKKLFPAGQKDFSISTR